MGVQNKKGITRKSFKGRWTAHEHEIFLDCKFAQIFLSKFDPYHTTFRSCSCTKLCNFLSFSVLWPAMRIIVYEWKVYHFIKVLKPSLKFLIIRNWIKKQPYLCYSIGIKKYGNNWRMLEIKLPSRSGPQIRSHAQKFMARIKNEYGTEDPLKFILEHPWDDLKLYKFEHFRENSNQVYSKGDSSNNNADDSSFKLSESKWF